VEGPHGTVAPLGAHLLLHSALHGELLVVLEHLDLAVHELQHVEHHLVLVFLLDEAEGFAVWPQGRVAEPLVEPLVDRGSPLGGVRGSLASGASCG